MHWWWGGGAVVVPERCRDKDGLFREPIYYNQDSSESSRARELLNEVHGYGVPRSFQDRELF